MCGRFTLTITGQQLVALFDLDDLPELTPRFNIAPTQQIAAVRRSTENGEREYASMRWGLIPGWVKDRKKFKSNLINARSETASSKPSFRSAFKSRRCLIATDGFYEWQKTETGKQPVHIRYPDRRPFAFAGLWERWRDREDEDALDLITTTILTTAAAGSVQAIHNRMPVIVPPEDFDRWLDPLAGDRSFYQRLFVPRPEGLEVVEVSRAVNSVRNDDPTLLEPPPPSLW